MGITKEELKSKVFDLKESWFDDITTPADPRTHFEKMVDSAIDKIDLDKYENNYIPAHIIFATILEKYVIAHINGSCDEKKRKEHKRAKNKLMKVLSIFC